MSHSLFCTECIPATANLRTRSGSTWCQGPLLILSPKRHTDMTHDIIRLTSNFLAEMITPFRSSPQREHFPFYRRSITLIWLINTLGWRAPYMSQIVAFFGPSPLREHFDELPAISIKEACPIFCLYDLSKLRSCLLLHRSGFVLPNHRYCIYQDAPYLFSNTTFAIMRLFN